MKEKLFHLTRPTSKNEVKASLGFYSIKTNKLFVLFIAISPMVEYCLEHGHLDSQVLEHGLMT